MKKYISNKQEMARNKRFSFDFPVDSWYKLLFWPSIQHNPKVFNIKQTDYIQRSFTVTFALMKETSSWEDHGYFNLAFFQEHTTYQ